MAAHIVECLDSFIFPQDDDDGEASNIKSKVIPGFAETGSVHGQYP
jgi:hypothetical protein